ncbi:MAG: fibronectin type III domain-containing protein [Planctomycetes bacterium]|nr:fibronectin type III domain-containing protein [Planctomycetota bacterium]
MRSRAASNRCVVSILMAAVMAGALPRLAAQEQVLVEVGDEWKYFKGTVAPPAGWIDVGFDDSDPAWLTGTTGIGYADGDDATVLTDMEDGYMAFFARKSFAVASVASVTTLTLQIDYDDGFVAYLNGTEIARRGLGNTGDPVAFDQAATGREAGTAEYIDVPVATLRDGSNVLAVQLHNTAIGSSDASLIPRLLGNGNLPPSGLACARPQAQGPVTLAWTNNATYDSVRVERNGAALATVGGAVTTYTDSSPAGLDNVYRVVGVSGANEAASNTCSTGCTQGTLTCTLAVVGGFTQATLSWSGVADVTSVQINREGAARATLTQGETSYVDPNVEDAEPELDTDFTVIQTTSSGATCTLACQLPMCPTLSAAVVDGQAVLTIGNAVRNWDHFEISRDGTVIDPAVPVTATTWTDTALVLAPGNSYTYALHPVAALGSELTDPAGCDATVSLGYLPEIGSFDPPEGGWDYSIGFSGPGDIQYNPNVGEAGNLDGLWIRSVDRDLWNGRGPDDPAGPAPDGPAPGGADLKSRPGLGPCGADANVLRILDPGNTAAPNAGQLGTAFPAPFTGGGNSRILLGLDLGITDRNVLKSGVTLYARVRLSPDAPAYMNPQPASGDGSGIANGIGHVGVYYRAPGALPDEGVTAGAALALSSGAGGGDIVFSAGDDLDAVGTLNFVSVWVTVVGGASPDTYDMNVYVNGATDPSVEAGGTGLTLGGGVTDFGPSVTNYLAIGSNDTGGDAMVEIDEVAYKLGVHVPTVDPCDGEPPPGPPRNLRATPGDSKVDLAWDAPIGGTVPTGYAVFRDGTRVATLPSTQTTYPDTGRTNGVQYCYKVRATKGLLSSADSEGKCATPVGGTGGPTFHRGDADNNGTLQLTDALRVLGFLFLGQVAPTCMKAGDADDNGTLQLTDALRILGFLFLGQVPPAPPGPPGEACGEDPTADSLDCLTYTSC